MIKKNAFYIPKPNPKARVKLFCFPYAGGSINTYRSWPELFGQDVEVVLIHPPGRGERFSESAHVSMAKYIAELLDKNMIFSAPKCVFFGHSLGSKVAWELCCKLYDVFGKLPDYLIASASAAPHLPFEHEPLSKLSNEHFKLRLKKLNGSPVEVLENQEIMELLMPSLRADFQLAETYISRLRTLPMPIKVLAGSDDPIPESRLLAWSNVTRARFQMSTVSGDHFFIDNQVDLVTGHVENILRNEIGLN